MKQESMDFLDANLHHWELLERAGIIKQLDQATREGFLKVIRDEWDPGYLINSWCADCVAKMLKFAFNQYMIYLRRTNDTRIVKMTFPKQ